MIENVKSKIKFMIKPERLRKGEIRNLVNELNSWVGGEDKKAKRESYIKEISEETGWNETQAANKLYKAKAFGISNPEYVSKKLFQLTDEELIEFALVVQRRKKKIETDNDFYIEMVCKRTGWSREKAVLEMNKAKESGVSYLKYVQKEYWSGKNIDVLNTSIQNKKKVTNENNKRYLTEIRRKTGWSVGKAELEVGKAKVNCGASYEDFLVFKFYEKSEEEQRRYVTLDLFTKMKIKYNEHRLSVNNFDNKAIFNEHFKSYIKHKWFVNRDMSCEEFAERIQGIDKLIVKPLWATQGSGIEVFQCNSSDKDNIELYNNLINKRRCIIEEYIVQNKEIAEFCQSSVNTVRVTTLNYKGECKFLYAVFRIGRGGVVDNFHAGGVAAAVDVESGIVCTNAVDLDGNVFTHSPATGKKVKGFKIPFWDEIISICKEITGKVEGTDLVGWDFAVTEKGIDLIEGNPGMSYVVAQIPYVEEGIGLADKMVTPYL